MGGTNARLAWLFVGGSVAFFSRQALGEPLRLRADAIAEARAPAGLVVLQGQDRKYPWVDAEALVWAGARTDPTADVLVLSVKLRAPRGWGDLRLGRFVVSTGAIRPLAIDGFSAIARAPWGLSAEAFSGFPVVPRMATTGYDQASGGRLAQTITSRATLGVSYLDQRSHGRLADQEIGADLAAVPAPFLDLAARGAYDLLSSGVADGLISGSTRFGQFRVELFGTHRSPSRLLPATSLFSVLGDFPSQVLGGTVRWAAAPRLDLLLTGGGQDIGGELGGYATMRGTLRLDERGAGTVGLEVRRQDVPSSRWTGVRVTASEPLGPYLRVSTEIEVAAADGRSDRGAAWPWVLAALAWRPGKGWEAAGAVEAGSTPRYRFEWNGLVRLARTLEIP
ncbi:MAG TPA: hypothetical protein VK540_26900 [Polyangiaceae bacterium]|nr:hypothetical protein [Polyangiaceae bacterium]